MKKLIRIVGLALSLLVIGCGDSSQKDAMGVSTGVTLAKAPPEPSPKARVALIMKTLTNPFFIEMEKGARRAQAESGIDLQVRTATQETSIEQQIQLVEQEIVAKTQAIVIAPGDSMRLVPVLKKAQDAGIRIVNIDNRLSAEAMAASGMKPVPFISVDNEAGAYEVTRVIASGVRGPAEAAVVEGIRMADNAQQRKRGAMRAFAEHSQIRVVAEVSANWKIDEAYEVAKAIFKTHPKVSLVFCANDMMAIGVMKFLQETGRHHVQVVGFDALEEAQIAIKAGQMVATVNQQADEQGYRGVQMALALLRGETPPMEILVSAQVVNAASLAK